MDVHLGRLICIFLFLFFGFASITSASVPEYNLLDVCDKTIMMPEGRSMVVRWEPKDNCTTCIVVIQPITDQGYIAMTSHPSTVNFGFSSMEIEPVESSISIGFTAYHSHVFSKKMAAFRATCSENPWRKPEEFTLTLTEIHRDGRSVHGCPRTSEMYHFCESGFNSGYCIPKVTLCNGVKDCYQSLTFQHGDESACGVTPSNNQPPTYSTDNVRNVSSDVTVPVIVVVLVLVAIVAAALRYNRYSKARKARGNPGQIINYQPSRPRPQSTIDSNRFAANAVVFATYSSRIPPAAPTAPPATPTAPPAAPTAPPQPPTAGAPSEYTIAAQPPSYSDLFGKNPPGFPGPTTTNNSVDTISAE